MGVGALLLVFGIKLARASSRVEAVGWALVVGGGVGNLIDRIVNDGHVVDFMRVGIGGLETGIFNVADTAILAGLVTLLVSALTPRFELD